MTEKWSSHIRAGRVIGNSESEAALTAGALNQTIFLVKLKRGIGHLGPNVITSLGKRAWK